MRGPGQGSSPGTLTCAHPSLPQLVAGIKYYLTVDMESTACREECRGWRPRDSPPAPGRRSTAGGNSCVPS